MNDLIEVLEVFSRDLASHVVGPPATEDDLKALERGLRISLPGSFRIFLGRFGGGLFYQGHEIFGPHRVVIHDIELVPSLPVVLARLRSEGLADGLIPFHRGSGLYHLLDVRPDSSKGQSIVSHPTGPSYPDLASFLKSVVVSEGSASTTV